MSVSTAFFDRRPAAAALPAQAVSLYQALEQGDTDVDPATLGRFLDQQLEAARGLPCDLPDTPAELAGWVADNASQVAERYAAYLKERRAGAPRRFFSNKAHALYFLRQVAPAKLVDGAWLYSAVRHADDWRYHDLLRTYLEELGDGDPALNHVVLYRELLAAHDCTPDETLEPELYLQGALQLALGHVGDDYLPEIIGYNLGYEQLPLHLLITAFELNELGIDPYYFTLHVTIDNASSGHARRAVDTVQAFYRSAPDKTDFLRRLRAGYQLNELGLGSTAVIQAFDLESELVDRLEHKRAFAQNMHSDYCRLEGRTVNEWLSTPGQIRGFLSALENKGWIKRHQDPQLSRFWQMVSGPGAVMFGVFSGYELQLLQDWIAGDWTGPAQGQSGSPFRARFRQRPNVAATSAAPMTSRRYGTEELLRLLAPALHATPEGLAATRVFSRKLSGQGGRG
jgi:hypothetical protein